jgi:hypothetical protein
LPEGVKAIETTREKNERASYGKWKEKYVEISIKRAEMHNLY